MRFVQFSYYKTTNHTALCNTMHHYLRWGAIIPFYGRFLPFGEHP